jgi:hypothetical protein
MSGPPLEAGFSATRPRDTEIPRSTEPVARLEPDRAIASVGSRLLGSDRGRSVCDTGGYGWIAEPERRVRETWTHYRYA